MSNLTYLRPCAVLTEKINRRASNTKANYSSLLWLALRRDCCCDTITEIQGAFVHIAYLNMIMAKWDFSKSATLLIIRKYTLQVCHLRLWEVRISSDNMKEYYWMKKKIYSTYNVISTSSVPELMETKHYKLNKCYSNLMRKKHRKCLILKFTLMFSEIKGP